MNLPARLLLAALALAGFARLLPSAERRSSHAHAARTLREYLELRARGSSPAAPPLGDALMPLVTGRLGGRALDLLTPWTLAGGVDAGPSLVRDPLAGWLPIDFSLPTVAAGSDVGRSASTSMVLAHDEACDGARLAAALRARLAGVTVGAGGPLEVVAAGARGHSPYAHLGLLEHTANAPFDLVVAVWDLADDLGQCEVLRRVFGFLPPGGDIDGLVAALADHRAALAATEAWLAAHPEARATLPALVAALAYELERRVWLQGGRHVLVLLLPDTSSAPHVAQVVADLRGVLAARAVPHLVREPRDAARREDGTLAEDAELRLADEVVRWLRR